MTHPEPVTDDDTTREHVRAPGLRPAAEPGRRQDVTGEQLLPSPDAGGVRESPTRDNGAKPSVSAWAVHDLILAEMKRAEESRVGRWLPDTPVVSAGAAMLLEYRYVDVMFALDRLDSALHRLAYPETPRCAPHS